MRAEPTRSLLLNRRKSIMDGPRLSMHERLVKLADARTARSVPPAQCIPALEPHFVAPGNSDIQLDQAPHEELP